MKNKNFSKKLSLNKATVTNLTSEQLQSAQGGAPVTSADVQNHCHTACETGVCCIGEITKDCQTTTN